MRARVVSAFDGLRWVATGWRLFRAAPLGWLVATLGYWLAMTVLSALPAVGAALAVVLVPAFSVGLMALARAAELAAPLELALLLDGFRQAPRPQLALGALYLAALAAVLAASAAADGGVLARWVVGGARPAAEALDTAAMAVAALAYLPVMLAFWFAPPLAAWHSTGAAKALFFSLAACLMNWRALAAYGFAVAAATLVAPLVLLNLLLLASASAAALAGPLLSALVVVLLPILFASFYASYRDVFGYHLAQ